MRLVLPVVFALLASAPAVSQVASPAPLAPIPQQTVSAGLPSPVPADAADASIDYAALREQVARENKKLQDEVAVQRAIVRKNQELLKEAQKLHTANLKLAEEKKRLTVQNTELERQRDTLKSQQKPAEDASR